VPTATDNRALYDLGRRYADRVADRLPAAWDEKTAVGEAAAEAGDGVKEARTAFDFARHVDAIAAVVRGARTAILDRGHPHLTPGIVARVAKQPDKIRARMARAAAGLHPFAPQPLTGLSPDQALWHYDLARLRDAQALLERAAGEGPPRRRLPAPDRADLAVHATAVRAVLDALRLVLGGEPRETSTAPPRAGDGGTSEVVGWTTSARELVEDATSDLLRAAYTRPVAPVREELAVVIRAISAAADAVRAKYPAAVKPVEPPAVGRRPGGPFDTSGTYAVVLQARKPGVVRIGRLGTFWLPAGYLLYVGSAFQGGGVASRTGRHLGGTGPRLWGLDDLRGFAAPVELWWMHHSGKVEHIWARALAGMPAYCCPAPVAGATDCNGKPHEKDEDGLLQQCPAHLFHSADRPSVDAFAGHLGMSGSGGYTVYHQSASRPPGRPTPSKVRPPREPGFDSLSSLG
jgi:Uri superfamily endonuclease